MRSRLYGKGVQHLTSPNQSHDPELLHLMHSALDAAWDQQQRSWDDIHRPRPAHSYGLSTGLWLLVQGNAIQSN